MFGKMLTFGHSDNVKCRYGHARNLRLLYFGSLAVNLVSTELWNSNWNRLNFVLARGVKNMFSEHTRKSGPFYDQTCICHMTEAAHHSPVSPSHRPLTLSPVTHPSAITSSATRSSKASKAANALL